ncbi:MAG: pyridoxal kinase [Alphaproteobacteria bacterium]|nr:MAG: pyridoxal kinase [Alphaproteobacteria bacterium]
MAEILSIQSTVVYGRVGHMGSAFALGRFGHDVWPLPTVLLSNHTGYATVTGRALPEDEIAELVAGLEANGLLDRVHTLLTGYLGSVPVAGITLAALDRMRERHPQTLYLCDPVLGDEGVGLYLPPEIGIAYRDRLLPRADIATPNEFELRWLTGLQPKDLIETVAAARLLGPPVVHVTSVRAGLGPEEIGILTVTPDFATLVRTPRLPIHIYGGGDLTAAILLAGALAGQDPAQAAVHAASAMHAVITRTVEDDLPEIGVVQAQEAIVSPPRIFASEIVEQRPLASLAEGGPA